MKPDHDLLVQYGAYGCVECGKCVALCPMAETARPFSLAKSPKGLVQQALLGVDTDEMPALLSCLQCRSCSQTCPARVDVAGLISALRSQSGYKPATCILCGVPLMQSPALRYLQNIVGEGYEQELVYPSLCTDCKRRAYVRNNSRSK